MKILGIHNEHRFFRATKFEYGEICTYSNKYFLWKDVKRLASNHNISIQYCGSETEEYKQYGDTCFRITNAPGMIIPKSEGQTFLFDTNLLDI
jgi:hypothetical protein